MTISEEMALPQEMNLSQAAGQLPTVASKAPFVPKTTKECKALAKRLAYNVVTGYVEHDRGHLDKAVEAFFQVYLHLFPDVGALRCWRAAELYVQVLVKQDEIENHPGHDSEQITGDSRWADVESHLLGFAKILDIPESYAMNTMNYYRYHGVRDNRYVSYCIESDRIINGRIIGSDYWSKILGSLYILLTDCHDKHDPIGLEVGLEFARKYYEIILRARTSASPEILVVK